MHERVIALLRRNGRMRVPWTLFVGVLVGFIAIVGANLRPPDPESRLPASYRLAALIQRQQRENEQQRSAVEELRKGLEEQQGSVLGRQTGLTNLKSALGQAAESAGTTKVQGLGITVTLDDSTLEQAPTGNVNDLVIHSQDVQAVVNGMWSSGAEAIAINGQRLVSTSAILCVGNTLLLNGTVHSPPYAISGIGVNRAQLQDDPLMRQLRSDAERFSLRLSVGRDTTLELPAYSGTTALKFAKATG